MSKGPIRVLLVEDNPGDARLIRELLSESGPGRFEVDHVEGLEDALARLGEAGADLVLLDLSLPDSQGLETLDRMMKGAPRVPVVVLTGHDDQEVAVDSVRRGAQDYLVKGRIEGDLLARAARYAIERKQAEETLRLTQFSLDHASVGIFWITPGGEFIYANEAASRSLGYTREELVGMHVADVDPGFPPESRAARWERLKQQGAIAFESRHRARDGRLFPVEVFSNFLEFGGRELEFAFAQDITARKEAEDRLRQTLADLERFNRLAVGRELRMVDLKREVNDMAERAGVAAPYDLAYAGASREGGGDG